MSDVIAHGTNCVKQVMCEICEDDGDRYIAHGYCKNCDNYLCEDCFNYHLKPKPARDHVLLMKDEMPDPGNRSSAATPVDACTELCERHPKEVAAFYCENHDEFFCNSCAATTHRKCDFLYVPDAAENFEQSAELRRAFADLQNIVKVCDENIERAKNNTNESDNQLLSTKKSIKNYIESAQKILQEKAEKVFAKMDEIHKENKMRMEDVTTTSITTKKQTHDLSTRLRQLSDKKQLCQLYTESKKGRKVITEMNTVVTNVGTRNKIQEQKCQIDKRLLQLVSSSSLFICIDPSDKKRLFPIYQGIVVKRRDAEEDDVPSDEAPDIPPPNYPPPAVPPRKCVEELRPSTTEEEECIYELIQNQD